MNDLTERQFWGFVRLCLLALWAGSPHRLRDLLPTCWLAVWTVGLLALRRYTL